MRPTVCFSVSYMCSICISTLSCPTFFALEGVTVIFNTVTQGSPSVRATAPVHRALGTCASGICAIENLGVILFDLNNCMLCLNILEGTTLNDSISCLDKDMV